MLMGYHTHDYIAWSIAIGVVIVFVVLLFWDGYREYKEQERRRLRNTQRRPHE